MKKRSKHYAHVLKNKKYLIIPVVVIAAYVVLACIKLRYPAVHYDEALYVNAALGGIDGRTFITARWGDIPLLLMPYIGALKAWLFYPIFKLFGISALTMRLPNVLLTAVGLAYLYHFVRREFNNRTAFLVLTLTALSSSFIMFTRLDFGPIVLDFILKIIGLGVLIQFIRTKNLWLAVSFWLVMLLGIFHKLNFIWYMNAYLLAVVIVFGVWFIRTTTTKQKILSFIAMTIGYTVCVAYTLWINNKYSLEPDFAFRGFTNLRTILVPVLEGTWFHAYALGPIKTMPVMTVTLVSVVACSLGLIGWKLFKRKNLDKTDRWIVMLTVVIMTLLAQILFTKQATAGWHYMSVVPFSAFLFILSLQQVTQFVCRDGVRSAIRTATVIVVVLALWQVSVYIHSIRAMDRATQNPHWSPAFYELLHYTKNQTDAQFVSLDWGTHVQLIGLDPQPRKYYELTNLPTTLPETHKELIARRYLMRFKNPYFISRVFGQNQAPSAYVQFVALAQDKGYRIANTSYVYHGNQVVFRIDKLEATN